MSLYIQYDQYKSIKSVVNGFTMLYEFNLDAWYRDYFNIDTADKEGLNNWGRILNRSRTVEIPIRSSIFFGMVGSTSGNYKPKNFNRGTFYKKRGSVYQDLPDEPYRQMLKLKWVTQHINPSIYNISQMMNNYYQQLPNNTQQVTITEGNMSVIYHFSQPLKPFEPTIFYLDGILPRPMGCSITIA